MMKATCLSYVELYIINKKHFDIVVQNINQQEEIEKQFEEKEKWYEKLK